MILIDGREIEFMKFPNGETKLIEDVIIGYVSIPQNVHFKYESDESLIQLMLVKRYLDSLGYPSPTLTIYYMPYSRMDRSENQSAFTLKYVADFINGLGFRNVSVIEPHSDVTPALLNNCNSVYINFNLLPLVEASVEFDPSKDFLFFPDAGAQKRYSKLNGYKQLVGFKHRDFATGKIKSLEVVGATGDTGKVIIVDDLSSYGGTFIASAEKLRKLGFNEIYLLVAHAENSIFKGTLFSSGLIDKIFTTNSILSEHKHNWSTALFKNKLHVFNIKDFIL